MMSDPRDVAWYLAVCAFFDMACAVIGLALGVGVWRLVKR